MDPHEDVHQTLEYRTDAALIRTLPYGLLLCLFGLFVFALDDDAPLRIVVAGSVIVAAGLGVIAIAQRPAPDRDIDDVDVLDLAPLAWALPRRP